MLFRNNSVLYIKITYENKMLFKDTLIIQQKKNNALAILTVNHSELFYCLVNVLPWEFSFFILKIHVVVSHDR